MVHRRDFTLGEYAVHRRSTDRRRHGRSRGIRISVVAGAGRRSNHRQMNKSIRGASRSSRRGRPPKYGWPSQVVAVTLPRRVVDALKRLHSDLGWAIVGLVETTHRRNRLTLSERDVQLVEVGDHQFLIVVNSGILDRLPGVQMVPFSATQAFLALEPGRGMGDLELAVRDRLAQLRAPTRERRAVAHLGQQLRKWRLDPRFEPHARSIIIVNKRRKR